MHIVCSSGAVVVKGADVVLVERSGRRDGRFRRRLRRVGFEARSCGASVLNAAASAELSVRDDLDLEPLMVLEEQRSVVGAASMWISISEKFGPSVVSALGTEAIEMR